MKHLREFLQQLIRESGLEAPLEDQRVLDLWPQVVGEIVAGVTEADRVENGILYVRVRNATWRSELSLERDKILRLLRERTGCRNIREVRFV
ncbi:MAG: DUF721 domain-containing protein [candidate division KSB1 bacterium]|nr:DUF721 domain-containing protein [candidate division KSB1 bacterium]